MCQDTLSPYARTAIHTFVLFWLLLSFSCSSLLSLNTLLIWIFAYSGCCKDGNTQACADTKCRLERSKSYSQACLVVYCQLAVSRSADSEYDPGLGVKKICGTNFSRPSPVALTVARSKLEVDATCVMLLALGLPYVADCLRCGV